MGEQVTPGTTLPSLSAPAFSNDINWINANFDKMRNNTSEIFKGKEELAPESFFNLY